MEKYKAVKRHPLKKKIRKVKNITVSRTANAEVLFCYCPVKLKKAFKEKAYRQGKDMTSVLKKLVEKYIKEG